METVEVEKLNIFENKKSRYIQLSSQQKKTMTAWTPFQLTGLVLPYDPKH